METLFKPNSQHQQQLQQQQQQQQQREHQHQQPAPAKHYGHLVRGIGFALIAVVVFSLTAPLTKVALTVFEAGFIAAARAFGAGCLALLVIRLHRWRKPTRHEATLLLAAGTGVVLGFPHLLNYALTHLSAAEMGVVLAALPLATSLFATLINQEKHGFQFWLFSLLGAFFLVLFMGDGLAQAHWSGSTALVIIGAVFFAGIGYAAGAKAAKTLGGWQTICWTLTLYLPISLALFGYYLHGEVTNTEKWRSLIAATSLQQWLWVGAALSYLILMSQWWGFKFWYQAMADFGAGKIAQVQLLQPFFTLLFAAVLLGEALTFELLLFSGLIAGSIFMTLYKGKK